MKLSHIQSLFRDPETWESFNQSSMKVSIVFYSEGYLRSFCNSRKIDSNLIEETSAGALVFRDDPIRSTRFFLVLHYPAGHWDFPKGAVETGETEEQAAKREIFEETGIRVESFIPNFRKEIEYHYRRQNNVAHKRVIFFLAQTAESKVRISFEHSGYDWLTYEQLQRRLTFENAKKVLREANTFLSTQEASTPSGKSA
jgi:bis(5'-nucleosidyl)-tetraphosphatase